MNTFQSLCLTATACLICSCGGGSDSDSIYPVGSMSADDWSSLSKSFSIRGGEGIVITPTGDATAPEISFPSNPGVTATSATGTATYTTTTNSDGNLATGTLTLASVTITLDATSGAALSAAEQDALGISIDSSVAPAGSYTTVTLVNTSFTFNFLSGLSTVKPVSAVMSNNNVLVSGALTITGGNPTFSAQ